MSNVVARDTDAVAELVADRVAETRNTPPTIRASSPRSRHERNARTAPATKVASGLHELAVASGCSVRIDRRRVHWFEPGRVVCAALGADLWATLASGCLLATFPQPVADVAVARLNGRFDATVLGRVETGHGVYDETNREIARPERDEVARILER